MSHEMTNNPSPAIDIYEVLRERNECAKAFTRACVQRDSTAMIRLFRRFRDLDDQLPEPWRAGSDE